MTAETGWAPKAITRTDQVTRAAVARFRATLDQPGSGDTAPQGFHWCLCLPEDPTAMLSADGHPHRGDFLPPVALPRRMWAGSTLEFLAPIPVHAAIERCSQVVRVSEKTGAAGALVFVEIDHVTLADGVAAVREQQTIVYLEPAKAAARLPGATGAPDLSGWEWIRSVTPGAALLFRYSALTFNAHRIHYDRPYALEEEGYPGLVVHGPLTATLLLDLCARRLGPDALVRFRFQAKSPAFADQPLHLVGRQQDGLHLRAIGADGRVVMQAEATPAAIRS